MYSFGVCLCVRYWLPGVQSEAGSAADQPGGTKTRTAASYRDSGKVTILPEQFCFMLSCCQNPHCSGSMWYPPPSLTEITALGTAHDIFKKNQLYKLQIKDTLYKSDQILNYAREVCNYMRITHWLISENMSIRYCPISASFTDF